MMEHTSSISSRGGAGSSDSLCHGSSLPTGVPYLEGEKDNVPLIHNPIPESQSVAEGSESLFKGNAPKKTTSTRARLIRGQYSLFA